MMTPGVPVGNPAQTGSSGNQRRAPGDLSQCQFTLGQPTQAVDCTDAIKGLGEFSTIKFGNKIGCLIEEGEEAKFEREASASTGWR